MCSKSMYDVVKEVRIKFIAINSTCFFLLRFFWKLNLVLVNGKTQELEPQMEVLQRGEPVEVVADTRLAIRAGFLDNWSFHHTFCFFDSVMDWHESKISRFRKATRFTSFHVDIAKIQVPQPSHSCAKETYNFRWDESPYNVSPCLCRFPDGPEGK